MIGRIHGTILEKQPPQLLIEAGGIGYEILVPMTTFYQLPEINREITLYTHLVIREDAHQLYGFYAKDHRDLFRALIKVNGVGPKLALTLLSGMEPQLFVESVMQNNISLLTEIPGIGKRTAERLIMETRDALSTWQSQAIQADELTPEKTNQSVQDAISALVALGYKPKEAHRSVSKIQQSHHSSEEIIRLALKQMMNGEK